jgi:hypothetical protein
MRGSWLLGARCLMLGYRLCARCRRHSQMFSGMRTAVNRERSLKEATNRFRPGRNVWLAATKALDRVQKLTFQPDVDSVSGVRRSSLVHGLNLPMHQSYVGSRDAICLTEPLF